MSTAAAIPSAATRVYTHLKRGILDGTHPGGEFFTEGTVAEATGVSRTPVREALLRLELEGLVRLFPKKGALVLPVSADEARHVLQARLVIEEWAAGAMWSRRQQVLDMLAGHLAAMRAARRSKDIASFVEHDRHFHEVIVAAAGNPILTRSYQTLRDRQLCIVATQMRMSSARIDLALHGHQELLDLLRGGTKAEFLRVTRAHLDTARSALQGA